jgi:hypothetical protein
MVRLRQVVREHTGYCGRHCKVCHTCYCNDGVLLVLGLNADQSDAFAVTSTEGAQAVSLGQAILRTMPAGGSMVEM